MGSSNARGSRPYQIIVLFKIMNLNQLISDLNEYITNQDEQSVLAADFVQFYLIANSIIFVIVIEKMQGFIHHLK